MSGMIDPDQGRLTSSHTFNRSRHLIGYHGQDPLNGREIKAVAVARNDFVSAAYTPRRAMNCRRRRGGVNS